MSRKGNCRRGVADSIRSLSRLPAESDISAEFKIKKVEWIWSLEVLLSYLIHEENGSREFYHELGWVNVEGRNWRVSRFQLIGNWVSLNEYNFLWATGSSGTQIKQQVKNVVSILT